MRLYGFFCVTPLLLPLLFACGVDVEGGELTSVSPRITQVAFAKETIGDGHTEYGTVYFADQDAGVNKLKLSVASCPDGAFCHDGELNLEDVDPDLLEQTSGSFEFGLTCDNSSGQAIEGEWELMLQDVDGNVSNIQIQGQ